MFFNTFYIFIFTFLSVIQCIYFPFSNDLKLLIIIHSSCLILIEKKMALNNIVGLGKRKCLKFIHLINRLNKPLSPKRLPN